MNNKSSSSSSRVSTLQSTSSANKQHFIPTNHNTIVSSKIFESEQTQQNCISPQSPRIDFTTRMKKCQDIKLHTKQLYEERFQGKLDDKNMIIPTKIDHDSQFSSRRRNSPSNLNISLSLLKDSGNITDADAYVSTGKSYNIFPAADHKVFPSRRPRTVSWKVGLRQYNKIDLKDDHDNSDVVVAFSTSEDVATKSVSRNFLENSSTSMQFTAIGKLKRLGAVSNNTVGLTTANNDNNINNKNKNKKTKINILNRYECKTIADVNKFLHAEYSTSILPPLSPRTEGKYFGDKSIEKFYATYQQLASRGQILRDGYGELSGLVQQTSQENALLQSVETLKLSGVISPRDKDSTIKAVKKKKKTWLDGFGNAMSKSKDQLDDDEDSIVVNVTDDKVVRKDMPIIDSRRTKKALAFATSSSKESASTNNNTTNGCSIRSNSVLDLDICNEEDLSLVDTYNAQSPRAIFITGCLQQNLPPISIALLRKKIGPSINLAHMGIGNKMAGVLATCVSSLPYLQLLNLTDNNLGDEGLSVVIRAISTHKTLEILDVSQNIIGSEAAGALASFVGDPGCILKCLRMSSANIDDGECADFVEVLMKNHSLQELDMSNNLLGTNENLNAVQPDFVTGGESLAELLSNPLCPLKTLNLHWNMIRLEGAEVLCNSLRTNQILTHLDLSYNALGSSAACVLGSALLNNNTLELLNVANNGIEEIGCFTLFVGVRENSSLVSINIDGNPVGQQGGRCLIKVAATLGQTLSISAMNCDFSVKTSACIFRINDPCGEYILDLSLPYERAVLLEIFEIVISNPAVEIMKAEYSERGDSFQVLKLTKFAELLHEGDLSSSEQKELLYLRAFADISKYSWQDLFLVIDNHCSLGPGMLAATTNNNDVDDVLRALKIYDILVVVAEIQFSLDPMDYGWINSYDLVEYLLKRAQTAIARIYNLTHKVLVTVQDMASTGGVRYIPPLSGKMRISISDGFSQVDAKFFPISMSNSKCRLVLKTAERSSYPLSLILFAIESSFLYIEEAKLLFRVIKIKTEDSIPALSIILQRMMQTEDAMRLLRFFVAGDILRLRRIKQRLGSLLNPLVGLYSGFYSLDLSNQMDRFCLKRLIEKSVSNCNYRWTNKLGDTSQNGNWSCFRNEYHYDNPDIRICPKYFSPLPKRARMEFDFVNIERPNLQICKAVSDDAIIDILLLSRLLDGSKLDWALSYLRHLGSASRKSLLSSGRVYWKTDLGRGINVNNQMYNMYCNLGGRKHSIIMYQKREISKVEEPKPSKTTASSKASIHPGTASKVLMTSRGTARKGFAAQAAESLQDIQDAQAFLKEAAKGIKAADSLKSIIPFRSYDFKNKTNPIKDFWMKRLSDLMFESKCSDEFKCSSLLEFFELLLPVYWLYCKQVALIIELFRLGACPKSNYGSYRVELIVRVFERILDLHNFELILMLLSAEEHAAVFARIGVLNLFNTNKPEGGWQFDLQRWDERQIAKMMIHLSVVEPGENWINPEFTFDHGFNPSPGWSLSVVWMTVDGLPKKGILSLDFFAGDGLNLAGCQLDKRLRSILSAMTLIPVRDIPAEFTLNSVSNALNLANSLNQDDTTTNTITDTNPSVATVDVDSEVGGGIKTRRRSSMCNLFAHMSSNTESTEKISNMLRKTIVKNILSTGSTSTTTTTTTTDISIYRFRDISLHGSSLACIQTQLSVLSKLHKPPVIQGSDVIYTYHDANSNLEQNTDISWSYTEGDYVKVDTWKLTQD